MNETDEAYGRDFEVEVFHDGKSTGMTFSVQLKSTAEAAYSADRSFLSVRLETPNARYLAVEMRAPVLLVQADVVAERLFWTTPQTDLALLASLSKQDAAETCTLRVQVSNELPHTFNHLVEAIGQIDTLLAARRLMEIRAAHLIAATSTIRSGDLSRSLRDKSDSIDLMLAQDGTTAGDFAGARNAIERVLSSPQASTESKFFALLVSEKNERLAEAEATDGRVGVKHDEVVAETAVKLQKLTRKGPGALKFYALLFRVASEFYLLVREDWGMYQNWCAHEHTGDLWWRAELRTKRARLRNRIVRKFDQFVRLVRLSAQTDYQSALPLAFLRIVDGAALLIAHLEMEDLVQAATQSEMRPLRSAKLQLRLRLNLETKTRMCVRRSVQACFHGTAARIACSGHRKRWNWFLTRMTGRGA